jgi:hypothetical protein
MKKNSVGLLELETADLECFLEKTPLSPLGVNSLCGLNYNSWLHIALASSKLHFLRLT